MIYKFNRYINGKLMAEGVTIERAMSMEDAVLKAAQIASLGKNREIPVLVLKESELEMPIEQFAGAVAKENARLREALEYIAEGGVANNLEDAYYDILAKARNTIGWKRHE